MPIVQFKKMDDKKKAMLQMVCEILSSSSSSDEELENIAIGERQKRQKIENYIDIVKSYSDQEFKRNFRFNRCTYKILKQQFEDSEYNVDGKSHPGSKAISVEGQLLSFLWYVGNKSTCRQVSSRFNMSESTFHGICTRLLDFLRGISPKVIKFPNITEEKQQTASDFERIAGFPNVLGCIDGTYISVKTPVGKIKSTYVNRHDMPAITLQGICNSDRKFIDVFTGIPSKIHDARVFKLSFISEKLPQICDNTYHILGDAAYPIRKWLLTPYRDYGNLTNEQRTYNYKFSATRVRIENTFGILKQRFRQLLRVDLWAVERISKFIIACCVLHNLCISNDDLWEDEEDSETGNTDPGTDHAHSYKDQTNNLAKEEGENKRTTICKLLSRQ